MGCRLLSQRLRGGLAGSGLARSARRDPDAEAEQAAASAVARQPEGDVLPALSRWGCVRSLWLSSSDDRLLTGVVFCAACGDMVPSPGIPTHQDVAEPLFR